MTRVRIMDGIYDVHELKKIYKEKVGRKRGQTDFIYRNIPVEDRISPGYIRVLSRYDDVLTATEMLDEAAINEWDEMRIRDWVRKFADGKIPKKVRYDGEIQSITPKKVEVIQTQKLTPIPDQEVIGLGGSVSDIDIGDVNSWRPSLKAAKNVKGWHPRH